MNKNHEENNFTDSDSEYEYDLEDGSKFYLVKSTFRKRKDIKKILQDKDLVLERVQCYQDICSTYESTKFLIEVCQIFKDDGDYYYRERMIYCFETILENMLIDLIQDEEKKNFRYNLVASIKKLLIEMQENDILKTTALIFLAKTNFASILEERESILLNEIQQRGLLFKQNL